MKLLHFLLLSAIIICGLGVAGCNKKAAPLTLEYHFADSDYGFTAGFADLPADYEEDIYELSFAYTNRPVELGSGKALRLQGHNRSDDLFMFLKKELGKAEGLKPNTAYKVTLEVDLAGNAPAGAVGIGGAPGEAVYVKIGAASAEPVVAPAAADGWLRLNLDKGNQSGGGSAAHVVGDVTKPTSDDFDTFETKTLDNKKQAMVVKTDMDGNLWIFFGTDSGFEGKTTIYYMRVKVTLTEK